MVKGVEGSKNMSWELERPKGTWLFKTSVKKGQFHSWKASL